MMKLIMKSGRAQHSFFCQIFGFDRKHGGMTPMTGVLQWMAINSSEGVGKKARGGGVALYVREYFNCLELDDGDDRVECLWVRIKQKANKADIMVGVC